MKLAEARALMHRMWNEGDSSHTDIAAATGCSVDAVGKWLAEQPGYPGIIKPRMVVCAVCAVDFPAWRKGMRLYCSTVCTMEARRRSFWRHTRRRRGLPAEEVPPRKQWRGRRMPEFERRIRSMAGAEARERGTTREAVLAEWKFPTERSTRP